MAQKSHGTFNFTHCNFNLLAENFNCSRQFQFAHGNFNLPTAVSISIYSRQFQFFFFTETIAVFFASLTTCKLRRSTVAMHQKSKPKIKSRYLKTISRAHEEKSDNHKSKVDLRTSRTKGYLHETGLGRIQTGMGSYRSPCISFHGFTLDLSKNELRPV